MYNVIYMSTEYILHLINQINKKTSSNQSNNILNGGNSFGSNIVIGTNDNNGINFITNNVNNLSIDNNGNINIPNLTPLLPLSLDSNNNMISTSTFNNLILNQLQLSSNNLNIVSLQAPNNLLSNINYTLPQTVGNFNNILSTDGTGVLSWIPYPISPLFYGTNILVVDKSGSDITGQRNGLPFLTINGAINSALSGDVIIVHPGVYNESIIIPNGVSLFSYSVAATIIELNNVISNTDLVIMGENTRLEFFTLRLSSNMHVNLRGIIFPNNTSSTAKVRTCVIQLSNSTADINGSSNVIGVYSNGVATPSEDISAIRATNIQVNSIGNGVKRGILIDGPTHFHIRDTVVKVLSNGGIGSYIGGEVNNINAIFTSKEGSFDGSSSDVSQTNGHLYLVNNDLINATSNGLSFKTRIAPSILIWADSGSLQNGIHYYYPGTSAPSNNEVFIRIPSKCVAMNLSIRARIAPSNNATDTWIVRKNGVNTSLTVSLFNTQTNNLNNVNGVSFNENDSISLQGNKSNLSSIADVIISLNIY